MTDRRLVVFDVDGTLVDSQHLIIAAMDACLRRRRPPAAGPRGACSRVVGLSLPEAMAALVPHLPERETLRLAEHYRDSFVAQRAAGGEARAPLYPGARAALDRLAADPATLLGVATGKARRGLDHILAAHGLGPLFATTQTADDHPSKPHPSMLLAALAETGCRGRAGGDGRRHRVRHRRWAAPPAWRRSASPGATTRARGSQAAGADAIIDGFDELDAALARLGAGRMSWTPRSGASGSAPRSGAEAAASASASTTGRCAPRPARRSSCRPRRWPRRSPPSGTRSTARSRPSGCR